MGGTTDILSNGLASFRASCKRKWEALQGRVVKPVRALFGRQRDALDDPAVASAGHRELIPDVSETSAALGSRCRVGESQSSAKRRRLLKSTTETTDSADVPVGTDSQNMPGVNVKHPPLEDGTVVAARHHAVQESAVLVRLQEMLSQACLSLTDLPPVDSDESTIVMTEFGFSALERMQLRRALREGTVRCEASIYLTQTHARTRGPMHTGPMHTGPMHTGAYAHGGLCTRGPMHTGPMHTGHMRKGAYAHGAYAHGACAHGARTHARTHARTQHEDACHIATRADGTVA